MAFLAPRLSLSARSASFALRLRRTTILSHSRCSDLLCYVFSALFLSASADLRGNSVFNLPKHPPISVLPKPGQSSNEDSLRSASASGSLSLLFLDSRHEHILHRRSNLFHHPYFDPLAGKPLPD